MSIVNEYYFQRADLDIKIAAVFDVFFIRYFSNNFALYRGDLNSQEYHRDNIKRGSRRGSSCSYITAMECKIITEIAL